MQQCLPISDNALSAIPLNDLRRTHIELSRVLTVIGDEIVRRKTNAISDEADEDRLALIRWAGDGGYCPD